MFVQVSYLARKDAKSETALEALNETRDILEEESWSTLLASQTVKPFSGQNMAGIYEVRTRGYRAAFCLFIANTALIFACFKKEGDKLKRTQLAAISSRAKAIRQQIDSKY